MYKIKTIDLNSISEEYDIQEIENMTLIEKKFVGVESGNPKLILIYSDTISSNSYLKKISLTDNLVKEKTNKFNGDRIIDIFKDDKSKLMLYYYLRSKRVILSIKYNVQIYEILGNEGLYEMIEHQIKTSSDFTNNSKVKRYKSYKEDLLDYCKDFYNFQLPEDEETFNKYVEYLTKEWNNNLDIQRKEKGYENLQLLDSKFAEVPINVQKEL